MIMQTAANEFTVMAGNTIWTAIFVSETFGWSIMSSRSLRKAMHRCATVADVEAKYKAFRGLASVAA